MRSSLPSISPGPRAKTPRWKKKIDWIQEKLWQTGGEISFGKTAGPVKNPVSEKDVEKLEGWIDGLCGKTEFKRFVRFHDVLAMKFNDARVKCRKTEASLVPLLESKRIRPETFKFFNRLGDLLYAAACSCEK
ncbi:MAG: ATP:cob(I)alamin adenosyltransferase [Candidatus Micrarchaeota archaeon]